MFKDRSIMIYASSFSSLLLWPLFKNTHILLEREREQMYLPYYNSTLLPNTDKLAK